MCLPVGHEQLGPAKVAGPVFCHDSLRLSSAAPETNELADALPAYFASNTIYRILGIGMVRRSSASFPPVPG
jgi:hypothetical protein